MTGYLTTSQAAELLEVSDRTVRTLCQNRSLRHERLNGRNIRIKREWIDEYLERITVPPEGENIKE